MRRVLFATANDPFIEGDLDSRNSRDKRSSYLKHTLAAANRKIRKSNKVDISNYED